MAYRHFEEFLIRLEQEGEVARIKGRVTDPRKLLSTHPQKATLYENIEWSDFPAAANVFGSEKRMAWALGLDSLEELNTRLSSLLDLRLPRSMGTMMARAGEVLSLLAKFNAPKNKLREIPAQEAIGREGINLLHLPGIRSLSGNFLFLPFAQIITPQNTGIGQVVINGPDTLQISPQPPANTPVAIVFGSDPALLWSLTVPLPDGFDRSLLAGWLRNRPIPYVRAVSIDVQIPSDAEMVLEGTTTADGQVKITTITHRRDAICPVFLTWEDKRWMRKASERLFLPLLRLFADEIADFTAYESDTQDEITVVAVHRPSEKVFFAIWGTELLKNSRIIVQVDAGVDFHNIETVREHILQNADAKRDLLLVEGYNTRLGIDATRKSRTPSAPVPDEIVQRLTKR